MATAYSAFMFRHGTPLGHLGELELAALDQLWAVEETDVTGLHAAIGVQRGIGVNTVGSTLKRLHHKKLVTREKISHAYRYKPAQTRDVFVARRMVEAVGPRTAHEWDTLLAALVNILASEGDAALDRLLTAIESKRRSVGRHKLQ